MSSGSQGADISAIPSMAIKQVEVLRDGAAALYGSDAIAGVIGFKLNDYAEGMYLEVRTGESGEGDGGLTQVQGNIGMPLGDDGFLNITGSWMEQDATSRTLQRTDAATLISSGNAAQKASVENPAQIYGAPEQIDNYNLFFNSGIKVSDDLEVYAFGNYGARETIGGFFYRNPNNRGGVYTNGSTRAVVDTNIRNRATGVTSNCPCSKEPWLRQ